MVTPDGSETTYTVEVTATRIVWMKNGVPHREGGKPAIIHKAGRLEWLVEGVHYRENGLPTILGMFGDMQRVVGEQRMKDSYEGAPCYIDGEGKIEWMKDGRYYRENHLPVKFHRGGVQWASRPNDQLPMTIEGSGNLNWESTNYKPSIDSPSFPLRHSERLERIGVFEGVMSSYDEKREGDMPTDVYFNGNLEWRKLNRLHREGDKPAVIRADGSKEWVRHGNAHREGGLPAVISNTDGMEWYLRGELSRDEGLPVTIASNGELSWSAQSISERPADFPSEVMVNGIRRDDTRLPSWVPAEITDHTTKFTKNGELHRLEGAAVVKHQTFIGDAYQNIISHALFGNPMSETEYNELITDLGGVETLQSFPEEYVRRLVLQYVEESVKI